MPCEESAIGPATPPAVGLDLPPGVPPLRSLYLYIAGSCNLACRHCWIDPDFKPDGMNGHFIRIDHLEKAIREAKPLGLKSVKLTGGEPLLHPEIRKILTLCAGYDMNISIETNGTLIDWDLAGFFRDVGRVRFISVSIDGATADVHDALRGVSGSFEKALTGICHLVYFGWRPQLICTLHRGNAGQASEVIKLAESLGCGSVKFNIVQKIGRGESYAQNEGLEITEILALFRRVATEYTTGTLIKIHFDVPMAFYPIGKLLNDSLSHCSIQTILGLLSGGELALCGIGVSVPELVYGHIETDDLKTLWCESHRLLTLRRLVPMQLEGICGQCLHRDICQGACVAQNYHLSGRINAAYYFCCLAEICGLFPETRKRTQD